MEKKVEDMTIAEIKALKRQYKKEFYDVLKKFFEERPLLKGIHLLKMYLNLDCDSLIISREEYEKQINTIYIYGGDTIK